MPRPVVVLQRLLGARRRRRLRLARCALRFALQAALLHLHIRCTLSATVAMLSIFKTIFYNAALIRLVIHCSLFLNG